NPYVFNRSPTTKLNKLSLHDALPIWFSNQRKHIAIQPRTLSPKLYTPQSISKHVHIRYKSENFINLTGAWVSRFKMSLLAGKKRSEEHTSELQSRENLVCRLLLETKK